VILDHLSQWRRYALLGPRFEKAFEWLQTVTPMTAAGRVDLEGDDLFATLYRNPTRPAEDYRFEAHRKYADIQLVVAGRERILWSPLAGLTDVTQAYNDETDLIFFARPVESPTPLMLGTGQFAIFSPQDGHAPGTEWGGLGDVVKVVVKVRLQECICLE